MTILPVNILKSDYDLCVIGSGPAGLILALEYARLNKNHQVLLLEYGDEQGTHKNDLDDSILVANPLNHHEPYECTNKGLGGTSATWGGRCVMYDEVDFIEREIVQGGCTWSLDLLAECKPYLGIACEYFECGQPEFQLSSGSPWTRGRIAEGFVEGDILDSVVERWSMPTRFGRRYSQELHDSNNISVMFGVEARTFATPGKDGNIGSLTVRERSSKREFSINAGKFVIAAGTQETTRLLLRNTQVFSNLDSPPDSLGRYYQGHLSGKIASVQFHGDPKKTEYGLLKDPDNIYVRRRFQLSTEVLKQQNLLNSAIWLDNPLYHDPIHGSGALSMFYLAMITPVIGSKLAPRAIANSITKGKIYKLPQHIWNVIKGLPVSVITPALIFYRRYCVERKLPQIFLYNPQNRYALHFHSEQVPSRENRMQLASDGESLEIHYSYADEDVESVVRTHKILDDWLQKCGCGHLEYWYPPGEVRNQIRQNSKDGVHQSGTTRMADSPDSGVVDRNLRVWGCQNLFVCSGSVLPTSSQANPTFMTGVLAVRLANNI